MTAGRIIVGAVLGLWLGSCGPGEARAGRDAGPAGDSAGTPQPLAQDSAPLPTIVFLGTSLTAGLGLDVEQAYPALLQRRLDSLGLRYRVVNAGVSGESSAGALRRIDWLLREPPALLVLETGANDGLRGQSTDSLGANIQALIDRVRARAPEARIILVGMEALPNLGRDYAGRFRAVYPVLAKANGLPLVPFLLAGVAGIDSLNQQDGMHPTAAGQRIAAENIWRVLRPLLR